jgi:hypothetical protein
VRSRLAYCFEVISCYLTETLIGFLVLGTCFSDCWWHHSHTSQWTHCSTKPNLFKAQNKTNILVDYGTAVHRVFGVVCLALGRSLFVTFWYVKGRFTHSMSCPCRAHAIPLPCRAAKGLECVFPIWFTQCYRVRFTLAMPCPFRAHAMLWPCRSSEGHGTARPSRDGLWATCPHSAPSGYHAEFHEDCYQKHTNPPHNDPYLRV